MNAYKLHTIGLQIHNRRVNPVNLRPVSLRDKIEDELMKTFHEKEVEINNKTISAKLAKIALLELKEEVKNDFIEPIEFRTSKEEKIKRLQKVSNLLFNNKEPKYFYTSGKKDKIPIEKIEKYTNILIKNPKGGRSLNTRIDGNIIKGIIQKRVNDKLKIGKADLTIKTELLKRVNRQKENALFTLSNLRR